MVSPDEITHFFQQLSPEAQRKAQEEGAYQQALATNNIAPLQPYLATQPPPAPPSGPPPVDVNFAIANPGSDLTKRYYPDLYSPAGPTPYVSPYSPEAAQGRRGTVEIPESDPRIIRAEPPRLWSGGLSVEDLTFKDYLQSKYRQQLPGLYMAGPSYSQARSHLANLAKDPASEGYRSTLISISKEQQGETEYAAWAAAGKPSLYPDTAKPPPGAYTTSEWNALTGLAHPTFAPGTEGTTKLSREFVEKYAPGGVEQNQYFAPEKLQAALARGEGAWGGGEPKSVSMLTGEEWGRQKAAEWSGTPAPQPTPAPDTVFPSGLADTEIKRAALGNMFGLGAPVAEGFADTDIKMAAFRQNLAVGGMSVPLAEIARPVREAPLRATPAEGFQGTDIPLTTGLATLRGFGEVPIPAMERVPQVGGPAQPSAMGTDIGSFYYPFAGLGVLGREVQRAGEGFASYLGRAGKTWIEEVGGIRPEPMPLPSEISADAKKFMEGGITKTETFTIPYSKNDPINRLRESMGLEQIKEAVHTKGTYTPFVDAEVTVRGEAGKGAKETFTEMLAGPPDPFRYITNIGPIKLPFKIGPIGRNEKVPLASEAYRLRAAPGVFTREVGSAIGLGIVKPVGQAIASLESPKYAAMAAPGVALAFGVGLAMLPGQIAMTTAMNPAAGAGQVYGLVAPFSLAGKLRGARFEAKPAEANIQFPSSGEGGVLLEVPKRGPIPGHVDLGGVVASRIMGRPVRSTVQVGEGGVFEIPLEWIDRPVVGGRAVSAEPLLRGLEIERRFNIRTRLADEFAIATEELVGKVPRSAETVDVFRQGRMGEAKVEMEGELFIPAGREGAGFVKGAPKGLFKPMYESVKTAEPWMKGTRDITTVDVTPAPKNLLYHGSPDWQPGSQLPIYLAFSREWAAGFAKMGPKGGEGSIIKEFQIKPGAVGIDISELKSKAGIDISKYGAKKYGAYDAKGNEVNLLDSINTKPGYLEFMSDVRNKGIDILFDKKDTRQLLVTNPNILIEYLDKPQVSTKYPIVRPQNLLEKITRRPAEEIKLVSQKRLLGYEATMSRETSGRLGEFMLGKTSPKGTIIRPKEIRLTTSEPLEGLTPMEIGAEATYGARGAPANLGLTEGAKGEPVFLGGIGAREKAVYTIKPEQFGVAPKALEKFGLKSSLKGERLEVEFGGVKGQPSLYDTPVGMKAVGGAIKIRPGLAEKARTRAGSLLERIKESREKPLSVDFQRKVKVPGPGDRRGSIFDYVEADRQELIRGAAASRAGDRSVDIGARGYKVGTGGAKAGSGGLISGGPRGRTAMGVVIERRGNMKLIELVDTESAGSGFRFYSAPGSRATLTMPRASLRGASLGLGAGALSLRDKIGTSEVMVGTQRESTRLLDVLAERTRPTQDLRMPGVFERERVSEGVELRRLEREKVTQGVGQIQRVDQRQQIRVAERVGQTERQVTVQKVEEILRITDRTETGGGGGGGPPPPDKTGRGFPIPRLGGFAMPRGSFRRWRPSIKINPIFSLSDLGKFSFGGGTKRGGRKASRATGTKRGRPTGSKTKKRGGKKR